MNPYLKLAAAAAFIIAGYGLARLMGDPPIVAQTPKVHAPLLAPQADEGTRVALPSTGARLVPDFDAPEPDADAAGSLPAAAPPLLAITETPPSATRDRPKSDIRVLTPSEPTFAAGPTFHAAVRAKLRNEAPRPLMVEPRPQFADPKLNDVARSPVQSPANSAVTIRASYLAPNESPQSMPSIGPPPWPADNHTERHRTHVVIDGDSLVRLAGRYLGNPRRSDEIYELNRGVLADPELLPIGAELVIPPRGGARDVDPHAPQSFAPRSLANHEAPRLVPVRPIPASAGGVPRAQLLHPLPAR